MSVLVYCRISYPAYESRLCAVSYCHLWPLWFYPYSQIISETTQFSKKKKDTEHKICVLSETFLIL